ncbi:methyltransferase domain-containing protein [Roseobacter sp. HKCCD9010]|uniref:SAM-dependent methyltransferase n=1 Tax=unclassified Roseobacter TaxID=196798 RepID=UPI001490A11F|nr:MULTISPECIES: cyclopropane-fatty-acyl-phospholipid synthase family protein [unclassified Roseobacter]MBF9050485.1 methyltransferase domain-containing protein [Rhodobacterales bacterium HKCCD4356]NNV12098.1 methyltransferase domain-containing protein [Roseobacter sp. HKCCD7357]NNV17112.1 methyltransferase domain-containing protein [Roseobacter sp. HKCCD8768]NNV26341.1 methyltransferase domain-containing protein [Roseobacter sp. HKCCD8192]NNV30836.1 methyltransferase domain-containing protein
MTIKTSIKGETDLPRYFGAVFEQAQGMANGRLDMHLPDGRVFRADGAKPGPVAELHIDNPDVFARLIREGDLGFCEAYLDGWWSTPDLQGFMDLIHADNDEIYDGFLGLKLVRAYERLRFWMQSNSKRQAKKNISHHYDLGNDFYGLWLDDTMTYSSALFRTGQEPLETAQIQKYASMVDEMGAKPGDHVLEIGCGWGGFAEYAAKERGLKVTGLTISQEQHDFAVARMERLGLSDRVEIKMQDYRDERGSYDGIASIEMFEAVGEKYWPTYFKALRDNLKPGKHATLQIITVQDRRWEIYRRGVDFIQKYIFPGGMLPSPTVLREEVVKAGLEVTGSIEFGESYSQTLRRWYDVFNDRWEEVQALGFDDRFRRMWNFYLTSCAATFHFGNCDVTQITVTRPR